MNHAYHIVPFESRYQEAICTMMDEIQDEFEIPFRNPNGKQISDIVSPDDLFWVALNGNQVLGTVGLSHIDDHNAFLRHLFVAKEARGKAQGVSKALLDTALQEATNRNYQSVYLGTMEQFKAAQKFYLTNHFNCISREELPAKMPVSPMDTIFYLWKNEIH